MEYGETISRTGIMLVQCDAGFNVFQDNVAWSPVGYESGAIEYIVSSNGRISIVVANREVFFFTVNFVADFVPNATSYGVFQNANSENIFVQRFGSRYFQAPFVEGTVRLAVYINGVNTEEVLALDRTASRGTVQAFDAQGGKVLFTVSGIDSLNEPLWLKVGNVMVAFCEPI